MCDFGDWLDEFGGNFFENLGDSFTSYGTYASVAIGAVEGASGGTSRRVR